jgi:hypothetical protein
MAIIMNSLVRGKGILTQLNLKMAIPIYGAESLLCFFTLFVATLGDRRRFLNDTTGLSAPPSSHQARASALCWGSARAVLQHALLFLRIRSQRRFFLKKG